VYGQTELTKDLFRIRAEEGQPIHFEVADVVVADALSDRPAIAFTDAFGTAQVLECDVVAGCDGFHGVSRATIPDAVRSVWERVYPYSWLGILAAVAPSTDELIYAWHPDGFALHSMRSQSISRLYVQVAPHDVIENWSDDRIWDALSTRLSLDGWTLDSGPTLEKSITPMRSFVSAPMRYGNLFLAGDAAHIVPPTGAKGLNLAIADVTRLSDALVRRFSEGSDDLVDAYSDAALKRVWRSTHFSWWMTSMLHVDQPTDPNAAFLRQMQMSQLQYVTSSRAAAASLAENYTGYQP
jgi:p-hydroxybenzoate 3-monooxygenase